MFVLVHGAWHGGWCWEEVEGHLGKAGAEAMAVNLPGRGADARPFDQLTLDSYVDEVIAALDAAPAPVVLVGHSLGGVVISQVAERAPEKVATLVYLCAILLHDGQSTLDVMAKDPDSLLLSNITINEAATASQVAPDAVHDLFYGDCSREVSDRAASLLVPEPIVPSSTPIHVTDGRWGMVERTYVLCDEDRAISPAKQRSMIADVGVDLVVEMQASHSPFLSRPEELAGLLMEVSA
jgi:pimeloyl-ACP methyl ester carboxylesterase